MMNSKRKGRGFTLLWVAPIALSGLPGFTAKLYGQSLSIEPEVRRALPVTSTSSPTPTPVMRALPADSTTLPSPVHSASTETQTIPSTPSTASPTTATSVDAPRSIRLTPATAADPAALAASQLAIAEGCYARKQPELAIPECGDRQGCHRSHNPHCRALPSGPLHGKERTQSGGRGYFPFGGC